MMSLALLSSTENLLSPLLSLMTTLEDSQLPKTALLSIGMYLLARVTNTNGQAMTFSSLTG